MPEKYFCNIGCCNDPNRSAKLRTCKFFFFILNFKNQFNQNFLEPSIFGAEVLVSCKFYFFGAFVGQSPQAKSASLSLKMQVRVRGKP
jgi:hypothetical protein